MRKFMYTGTLTDLNMILKANHNVKNSDVMLKAKCDIIIGKFRPDKDCHDGYMVIPTPNDVKVFLRQEQPELTCLDYLCIVATGCKSDEQFLKAIGY